MSSVVAVHNTVVCAPGLNNSLTVVLAPALPPGNPVTITGAGEGWSDVFAIHFRRAGTKSGFSSYLHRGNNSPIHTLGLAFPRSGQRCTPAGKNRKKLPCPRRRLFSFARLGHSPRSSVMRSGRSRCSCETINRWTSLQKQAAFSLPAASALAMCPFTAIDGLGPPTAFAFHRKSRAAS